MIHDVVILGAGALAREVLDIYDAINAVEERYRVLGFIVDQRYGSAGQIINGIPILGGYDWLKEKKHQVQVICGVGSPELRLKLLEEVQCLKLTFSNAIHPNVVLTKWLTIGTGVVIAAGTIISNNVKIGNHILINFDCTIGHDCVIEDYSCVSPGAHVSGNVILQKGCYIGTGANIIEKKTIGAWAMIGAGSMVVKDVPSNATVIGVPARVVNMKEEGWYK